MIESAINIKTRINQKGFTLIELAIVLVIVGVLIGSFIGSLTQRIENSRIAETENELDKIKTALLGYAYANRSLPCADCFSLLPAACPGGTARDGAEDRFNGECSSNSVGTLPWITLGLAQSDAWSTRYRYWVDPVYAADVTSVGGLFTLDDPAGTGQVDERDSADAITPLASRVVAVVISNGKNSYGGISTSGIAKEAIPVANIDEMDNLNADNDFISRPLSGVGATTVGGEFDDILTWITEFELKAKMVEAGRLP